MKKHLHNSCLVLSFAALSAGLFACGGDDQPGNSAAYDSNGHCSQEILTDRQNLLDEATNSGLQSQSVNEDSSLSEMQTAVSSLQALESDARGFEAKWGGVSCTVADENGNVVDDSNGNPIKFNVKDSVDLKQVDQEISRIQELEALKGGNSHRGGGSISEPSTSDDCAQLTSDEGKISNDEGVLASEYARNENASDIPQKTNEVRQELNSFERKYENSSCNEDDSVQEYVDQENQFLAMVGHGNNLKR